VRSRPNDANVPPFPVSRLFLPRGGSRGCHATIADRPRGARGRQERWS
jgi:hypothetical protein